MSRLRIWIARISMISIAPTVNIIVQFSRTFILSRMLAPNEFGTGVALSVALGTINLVSDVSLDKFAIVGTDSEGLAALHVISLTRGLMLAAALAVSAPIVAQFFGVSQSADSFALTALVPLIYSFAHLGTKQVQRDFHYGPETVALVTSSVLGLAILIPAVFFFRDHRAIVASFLVEATAYMIASHLLAHVPYRMWPQGPTLKAALSFGFPVMLNGIGLAGLAQLDRIIVGHWFGVSTLGLYTVILNIGTIPISLMGRVFGTMSLSHLAAKNQAGSLRVDDYSPIVLLFTTLGVLYSLFVALTLDVLTPFVFGHSFTVAPTAHILITVMVFFELQRGGATTIVLLVTGRTRDLAILNIFSGGFGILLALVLLLFWPRFESVLVGLLAGAICAFVLSFFSTSARMSAWGPMVLKDLVVALAALTVIVGMLILNPDINWGWRVAIFAVGLGALLVQITVGLRGNGALRNLLFKTNF
jgi:O-antigen/teichoic acid export membrane protein